MRRKNTWKIRQWGCLMLAAVLLAGCGNGEGTIPYGELPYENTRGTAAPETDDMQDQPGDAGMKDGQVQPGDAEMKDGQVQSGDAGMKDGQVQPGDAGMKDGQVQPGDAGVEEGQVQSGDAGIKDGPDSADALDTIDESGASADEKESLEPEITLVMVGDILLHTPVAESGKTETGYDFRAVFANMKEQIEEADLALVNQEVILGGEALGVSGYPTFNAPFELGDALADTGFDVVLHATNHALDKGKNGILNSISFWEENHPEIAVLGIHDSQEGQQEIYVYEQEGIRIAILNYTYGTNGIPLPADMPYAVDMLERERVISDLKRAEEMADFTIVCPHWGTEYVLEATREQENWAALFAENGADLILGTHPHVIEPVVSLEEGALVYYSLGNFVNWTASSGEGIANRMVGGMARVTIGVDEEGETVIRSYDVEPLICHVESGFGGVTVYPLSEYTEELAERNEIIKQDGNFSLEYCRKLVKDVFGEE